MFKRDSILVYSFGGAILIITGLVFWNYATPEWKDYQDEFRETVAEKFGADRGITSTARTATNLGQGFRPRRSLHDLSSGHGMERVWTAHLILLSLTRRKS